MISSATASQPAIDSIIEKAKEEEVPPQYDAKAGQDIINEIPDRDKYTTSELNRIGACLLVKKEGNEFFAKGDYRKALESYEKLTRFMGVLLKGEKHLSDPIKLVVAINSALCYIKLNEFSQAVTQCDNALEIDAKSIKAYYRRALAKMEMGKFDDAREDFNKVLEIDPSNKDTLRMMQKMKVQVFESNQKGRQMYGGLFNKTELYDDKKIEPATTAASSSISDTTAPSKQTTVVPVEEGDLSVRQLISNKYFWIAFGILFPIIAITTILLVNRLFPINDDTELI